MISSQLSFYIHHSLINKKRSLILLILLFIVSIIISVLHYQMSFEHYYFCYLLDLSFFQYQIIWLKMIQNLEYFHLFELYHQYELYLQGQKRKDHHHFKVLPMKLVSQWINSNQLKNFPFAYLRAFNLTQLNLGPHIQYHHFDLQSYLIRNFNFIFPCMSFHNCYIIYFWNFLKFFKNYLAQLWKLEKDYNPMGYSHLVFIED